MEITRRIHTDVLVIGAGAAGLRAALAAADAGAEVLVTNKGPLGKSGITLTAAGGMQAPFHSEDSADQYYQDTLRCGYGLGDPALVQVLAEEACAAVESAERYGVSFVRDQVGQLVLGQFPGQTYPRGLSIRGGGIGLVAALGRACGKQSRIHIQDDFFIITLLQQEQGEEKQVAGALGMDLRTGGLTLIYAKATILATGGCQWLWEVNDCPGDATGDGIIYASRAGAELVDMEMVLFYPTVIVWPPSLQGAFVHYEFLAPAMLDGNVYDRCGQPVLPKPLPVRDAAMRLLAEAISDGRGSVHGGLFWYVGDSPKGLEAVRKQLNNTQYNYLKAHGVDPATAKIETAPGAHYLMGGIRIQSDCRTNVKGLFAVPECAGNFDGANRLAGSGLTATQVFGARAGRSAQAWSAVNGQAKLERDRVEIEREKISARLIRRGSTLTRVPELRIRLRAAMQAYGGVMRDAAGLQQLLQIVQGVREELKYERVGDVAVYNQPLMELLQLEVMVEAAEIIASSALLRTESRGHHFRVDYPTAAETMYHTIVSKGKQGLKYTMKSV